jgi:hypothetical protein
MLYVIDAKGVIRYRNPDDLEGAVLELLDKMK